MNGALFWYFQSPTLAGEAKQDRTCTLVQNTLQPMYSVARVTCQLLRSASFLPSRLFAISSSVNMTKTLNELTFVNGVLKNLPIDEDPSERPHTVRNACFSLVKPTPLPNPRLVCYSLSALKLIDLDESSIDEHFVNCFTGNEIIPGSETFAHCYCGHQFGKWLLLLCSFAYN